MFVEVGHKLLISLNDTIRYQTSQANPKQASPVKTAASSEMENLNVNMIRHEPNKKY